MCWEECCISLGGYLAVVSHHQIFFLHWWEAVISERGVDLGSFVRKSCLVQGLALSQHPPRTPTHCVLLAGASESVVGSAITLQTELWW